MAAGLARILTDLFRIGATNYYDDFMVFESAPAAAETTAVVDEAFELLGWSMKPLEEFGQDLSSGLVRVPSPGWA